MTPPAEFSREYIAANSKHDDRLYAAFVNSGEPFKSTMKHNFHMGARQGLGVAPEDAAGFANTPSPGLDLTDEQLYYNTKKAKEYWKGVDLPKPTKDLNKLRDDLKRWGYCLIQDGMSKEQVERARKRVIAQADGERLAGVACFNGSPPPPNQAIPNTQLVHCLIAKGEQFVQILEQDPAGCQAAPVIEQLISETIGPDFLISSFISIIAGKHNIPQNMHQDQACSPHQTDYPLTCNTMYLLDPFSAENGGTLVIPGSHLIASKGVSINEPLPPAINLEAPAGTVVVFEGRVLHGTGVNTTDQRRVMIVTNSLKPFMRQQEVHLLSTPRDILLKASPKLLYRLGFRPTTALGGVEGNWRGEYQLSQRLELESGNFVPIRELSPQSSKEELMKDYTYRHSELGARLNAHQEEAIPEVKEKYKGLRPAFEPPKASL